MEAGLNIKGLYKTYGETEIFNDFDISFAKSKINCILGPSGCGKTSLLNIICGSLKADAAGINDFKGRKFSYVFQEPRLLPWKTAEENIAFTLRDRVSKKDLGTKIQSYLELVELEKFRHYFPAKLSGGMKQRLSLARAFSYPSEIILMDEPFKALDMKLKTNLMNRFLTLWEEDRRTVIYVTHDVDEALALGDIIHVFEGPPVEIIKTYRTENENKAGLRDEITELIYRTGI